MLRCLQIAMFASLPTSALASGGHGSSEGLIFLNVVLVIFLSRIGFGYLGDAIREIRKNGFRSGGLISLGMAGIFLGYVLAILVLGWFFGAVVAFVFGVGGILFAINTLYNWGKKT